MLLVIGMVAGAAVFGLVLLLERYKVAVRWYEWLLGAMGFIMAAWAIHDFFASMGEYNETAGRLLLIILGIPALILLALAVFLPWRRRRRANPEAAEKPSAAKD